MANGDKSVAIAGTHVGKEKSSVTVRAQDILPRQTAVSYCSLCIHANRKCDERTRQPTPQEPKRRLLPSPEMCQKRVTSRQQVESSIFYPYNHDVEKDGFVDSDGHLLTRSYTRVIAACRSGVF